MLFNTWQFAFFAAVVYPLYFLLGVLGMRAQNVWLLLASYYFYACWDWRFLPLLMATTVMDFFLARWMSESQGPRRLRWLQLSLAVNLGVLGFFKYCNFFIASAAGLLTSLGFHPHLPVLNVLLPIGISFYTFHNMSYTIDVYYGRVPASRNFLPFALYIAYFPQLVAGPIARADKLLPQFERPRTVSLEQFGSGALLVLIGMVRKVAVADVAAMQVDNVFANPSDYGSVALLVGVSMFAVQIYGDFAGYTDMARGLSRMMGIELSLNFQQPYFASSVTDFWRRWHISLSTWLRDYLYIPLGGNRGSGLKTYRNLMLTMLLGGLWHGANWTFVVWGAIHGLALSVERLLLRGRQAEHRPALGLSTALGVLSTLLVVNLAWVFFRAPDFATAFEVLHGIAALRPGVNATMLWLPPALLAAFVMFALIDWPQYRSQDELVVLRWPWPVRGLFYAGCVLLLVWLRREDSIQFLYFQF